MRPATRWALLSIALVIPCALPAQVLLDQTEDLHFDRPESWAMKYYGSVTLLTVLGGPQELAPGEVVIGFECSWLPTLSAEQQRVGFFGIKEEDLNRSSVFGRGRLLVGLPGAFVLTAAYVPPVDLQGIEPHLLAVGVGRTVAERGRWRLGAQLSGELGALEGDITCSRDVARAGDDPERNPFGCLEPSSDELEIRYGALELASRFDLGATTPHLSLFTSYFDTELQVDARYRDIVDRSRLRTTGWTWGATAGLSWRMGERTGVGLEAFYSPLEVFRAPGAPTETDELFHVRAMVTYRVRSPGGP